ncbi:hypothetical protein GCM10009609_15840 [Pseudonocardia aurantiaca]|uniref:Uncharacterized protein n=1 Tax=Pseudonocardia aurantiaca TaxID=75290 RepID=A0ABW4FKZ8_9PSEU
MKIVAFDDSAWVQDHPLGTVSFQHLLKGQPDAPDNFMYILGRQDADFWMPRHRHNFEQIRLPVRGDMNLGRGTVLREGEVGYFPEGLAYGPQDDPLGDAAPGERLQLVLQFGGASGCGFMSIEQRRQARKELSETGRFDGNYYCRSDGKAQWGLNAIWEHVYGERLRYPRSRYKDVIIADPKRFNWLPVPDADNVHRKHLGSFSERGVWIEMIRLRPGSRWSSADPRGRRLMVVLSGTGAGGETPVERLAAIQVESGETLELSAETETEIFVVGLPPVDLPQEESKEFDYVEISDAEGETAQVAAEA